MAISVEDVQAFREFVLAQYGRSSDGPVEPEILYSAMDKLTTSVHPLALGNVHRVHKQIKRLGEDLLSLHPVENRDTRKIIEKLASGFCSHLHMVNRSEAVSILGEQVEFASAGLAGAMDALLRSYEESFELRKPFLLAAFMGDELDKNVRFVGGVVESRERSYLFETKAVVRQHPQLPANVQVQLPLGQRLPPIPGLPRGYAVEVTSQGWIHNKAPQGVTI